MNGKMLGNRYELIEKIGSGGMAVVYKAKCHLLNRFVAVKMLRDEYSSDQDFIKKFRKEAQSAARLSHQNIVNIYDVGMEDTIPYIVMEYIAGVTLKEYIDSYDGFLTNEEIANFTKQIALALEHAHKNQIIHRDIKPHNILVANGGVLKVADFGIASAISENTTSYSSEAIGSVRYSSPEQARGRNVDERTDIYSLGVLMYEMATRNVPFEGDTAISIALKHLKDDIVVPTTINRCFNKGLESIVMRSLLKDIGQRYQNARELIEDLNKIIDNPNENIAFYSFDSDSPTQKIPNVEALDKLDDKSENRKMNTKPKTNKKKKKASKNKLAIAGVILLAFVTALTVFILIRLTPSLISNSPESITLQNVIGMEYEAAKSVLENDGFLVKEGIPETNNSIAEGKISSQSPAPESPLKVGYSITLNVSTGATKNIVPSLIHKEFTSAKVTIGNSKFALGDVVYVNDDLDKGYVISQSPDPGTEANNDTAIDLVVSLGQGTSMVIMPSLINKTVEDVQKALLPLKITLNDIKYEYHPSIKKDLVITQSVSQGTETNEGISVDVVVSLGMEEGAVTETETEEVSNPNLLSTKVYIIPLIDYLGQTVEIKVMYEKNGTSEIIYTQNHEITEEASSKRIEVTNSGTGTLYFIVNDSIINSSVVDFSN